jgi:hypothetical protein
MATMFVVDFPRTLAREDDLVLPPYHGHLGFMPGLKLHVQLMAPRDDADTPERRRCELLCTSYFPQAEGELVHMTCKMKDDLGVVAKLFGAIAEARANVVVEESSVVDHLDHHMVSLILDFSQMGQPQPIHEADSRRIRYRELLRLCPTHDWRYLHLLSIIIGRCGRQLNWIHDGSSERPDILMAPLSSMKLMREKDRGHGIVQKGVDEQKPGWNKIWIDKEIRNGIHIHLGIPTQQSLKYLLLSQGPERTLRVMFPRPELANRLLHIGFQHADKAGSLAAITGAVAAAKFNIITSILRRHTDNEQTWEAVLEDRNDSANSPLGGEDRSAQLRYVHERITSVSGPFINALVESGSSLVRPAYPPRRSTEFQPTPLTFEITSKRAPTKLPSLKFELERQRMDAGKNARARLASISLALEVLAESASPHRRWNVFLSLPRELRRQGEKLAVDLAKLNYGVEVYLAPDNQPTIETVVNLIRNCDYFLGIWQGMRNDRNPSSAYPSSWLPFELGIARSESKEWALVACKHLDNRLVDSLKGDRSIPRFDSNSKLSVANAFRDLTKIIENRFGPRG